MNFHMFILPWLLLVLAPLSTTADMNLASERTPEPGKDLYTVSPKEGTDISAAVAFIKSTVHNHDLHPCADVGEQSMFWTVEASPSEVTKLEGYDGIVSVVKVEIPAHQEKQRRKRNRFVDGKFTIYPVDRDNQDQCKATSASLVALLNDKVTERRIDDRIKCWEAVDLTIDQVRQVEGFDGVHAVGRVHRGRRGHLIRGLPKPSTSPKLSTPLKKRDITYEMQKNAVPELVAISQPSTIPVLKDLKNYVYESHAGGESYVYHIETGVAFKVQSEEFPNVASTHLLTPKAIENHKDPSVDDDDGFDDDGEEELPSHSTCTAGKALGAQFGASKKATLVVVKLDQIDSREFEKAMALIIQDLDENPERRKKSVVTMSLGMGQDWDDDLIRDVRGQLENLFARDVPFVCNAGNIEDDSNSAEVDEYPALLEGPDLPLIVVGSVNSEGERSEFSQAGPHVSIHALGEEVLCLPKDEDSPMEMDGTSFATPLVAGEIANLLSYETVPFDTSDGNLVRNLKAYLQSDKGSWERVPGIRVIWNGVTEENNPRENVECNSLEDDMYVERDDVKNLIENEFCPSAEVQGGLQHDSNYISRTYNEGTPNEVTLSMGSESGLRQYIEDCAKYLMMAVDGCDKPSSANPASYKSGGMTTVGSSRYRVSPGSLRAAAEGGKQAGCDSAYKVLFNEYWVWGHGWASSDGGESLKGELEGCALLPDTWSFEYGIGDDGREWTAKFRTGVFQKSCVGNAVSRASGIDLGCKGSG